MPPKVQYGKKRPTSQTQTSYTKFVSPKKTSNQGEDTKTAEYADWGQQLEAAAEDRQGDVLVALQKGLEGLGLEHKPDTQETTAESKTKTSKNQGQGNTGGKRQNKCAATPTSDDLEVIHVAARDDVEPQEGKMVKGLMSKAQKARLHDQTNRTEKVEQTKDVTDAAQNEIQEHGVGNVIPRTPGPRSNLKAQQKSTRRPKKHPLPTPEPTPEPTDVYTEYVASLLSLSLGRKITTFEQWSIELEPHFEITKIAEASFSEVFRLSAKSTTSVKNQESVLKVVALKTPPEVPLPCQLHARAVRDREAQLAKERAERDDNDIWKSDVPDVLSEVKLLQNLNHIPGFTNFRDLTILQGRPSASFSDAWKIWNKSRSRGKKSEFPDPSKKTSYNDTQLWAIIEMQDAGTDCEKLIETNCLSSIWEIWDVFWGVCLSVAKAEETCRFEHRDLHMGNICVRPTRSEADLRNCPAQDPLHRKLRFTGLETTVIDYTLSRADILASASRRTSSSTVTSDSGASTCTADGVASGVAYLDLDKDPAIFEGDASVEYQYEIYRYMRGAALYNNPLQQNAPIEEVPATPRRSPRKNNHIRFDEEDVPLSSPRKTSPIAVNDPTANVWEGFHPKTNLVWTHFLLHKLMKHLVAMEMLPAKLSTKQIMSSLSAEDQTSDPLKVKKKALKLYKVLERVSELLCPVALGKEDSIGSVKELVVLALEDRWLRVEDVAG